MMKHWRPLLCLSLVLGTLGGTPEDKCGAGPTEDVACLRSSDHAVLLQGHLQVAHESTSEAVLESSIQNKSLIEMANTIPKLATSGLSGGVNASSGSAIVKRLLMSWEMRVTTLPLIVLEACALLGVNQGLTPTISSASNLHTFALEPFRFLGVLHIVLMQEAMARKEELWWRTAAAFGKYWVQFFFCLSGFVLYISRGGATDVSNPGAFIVKRLVGVYPAYAIGTLLVLLTGKAPSLEAWDYLVRDSMPGFLLVDSWASPYGTQSPDGPAWFACTLFAFWLCFPTWYRFLHGLRAPKFAMLLAYLSSFALPILYSLENFRQPCHSGKCAVWGAYAEFHPFSNWPTFFFGMCIGRVLQDTKFEDIPSRLRENAATVALVMLLSLPLFAPLPSESILALFFDKGPLLLPVFALLISFTSLGEDTCLRPQFLEWKVLQYLGAVSGHFFLLYAPVRLLVHRMAPGGVSAAGSVVLPFLTAMAFFECQQYLTGPSRSSVK